MWMFQKHWCTVSQGNGILLLIINKAQSLSYSIMWTSFYMLVVCMCLCVCESAKLPACKCCHRAGRYWSNIIPWLSNQSWQLFLPYCWAWAKLLLYLYSSFGIKRSTFPISIGNLNRYQFLFCHNFNNNGETRRKMQGEITCICK